MSNEPAHQLMKIKERFEELETYFKNYRKIYKTNMHDEYRLTGSSGCLSRNGHLIPKGLTSYKEGLGENASSHEDRIGFHIYDLYASLSSTICFDNLDEEVQRTRLAIRDKVNQYITPFLNQEKVKPLHQWINESLKIIRFSIKRIGSSLQKN